MRGIAGIAAARVALCVALLLDSCTVQNSRSRYRPSLKCALKMPFEFAIAFAAQASTFVMCVVCLEALGIAEDVENQKWNGLVSRPGVLTRLLAGPSLDS